ncbi:MAG: hypothetical protein KDA65_15205, partial [Planctomycetaceae bacterium]|nr:hypothetical protein [Planctomycetaceae bacterium]
MATQNKNLPQQLSELENGQTASCFALLSQLDQSKTRDGKPYYRASFRDRQREVVVMVWSDSPWFTQCESSWEVGSFYRITGKYEETKFGP